MSIKQLLLNNRLDSEMLIEMYDGDYEHAEIVFGQFVKNAPVQMNALDQIFKQGIVEDFRAKVHKLKPVFSFVGLTHLSNQAASLEAQCKQVNTLVELENNYQLFKNDFDSHLPLIQDIFKKITNEV